MNTFPNLNLPACELRINNVDSVYFVFDIIRKKNIVLTPEEWVRQHLVHYLMSEKNVPAGLISLEAGLTYNTLQKRSDILIYDRNGKPLLLCECKAAEVKIGNNTFEQVAAYNKTIGAPYLIISNGLDLFMAKINFSENKFEFLKEIPIFDSL